MNEKILILVGHKNGKTSLTSFFLNELEDKDVMSSRGHRSRWFESSIVEKQPKFIFFPDDFDPDWDYIEDLIKDIIHGNERTIDVPYAPARQEVIDTKFIIHVTDERKISESIKRYALIYHLNF